MTLDAAVLDQSGWPTAVQRLWRRMAHDVHAFYADARVLRGYRLTSGTHDEWRASGRHPVCGPFWMGIPKDGAVAVGLGPSYLSRWQDFQLVAAREGERAFVMPNTWTGDDDALATTGPVPDRLAQQSGGYGEHGGPNPSPRYPIEWPFDDA